MEEKKTKVKVKNVAQSPLKLRLVADLIRGKEVTEALDILEFTNKKGTFTLKKALLSAIASALEKFNAERENLIVSHISIDEAPTIKSGRYVSRGRATRILKRRSHINLEVKVK
ncbi:50S ribosomal protein L22 [Candidatus Dojkabacteria bacterium]|uniref:Large ribosomal subunit protein uL22 n=1 Tax=Candidatus Dojkabacteria bacterium TaxID=2099670 RepID=A0A847VDU7_9BACT|nr:50S ribosomal protein L22 [Candidatus Dojkabacteria bacterium]